MALPASAPAQPRGQPDRLGQQGRRGQPGRLGLGRICAYALPALPISALGLPMAVHLPAFYIYEIGIPTALVGFALMLARLWDVGTDPLMGILSDRMETRFGKRRIWLVLSIPILAFCAWKLFNPPADASWLYLLFWLVCIYIGWTMIVISHISWGAELSDSYHERSVIQAVREAFLVIGMVVVLALPAAFNWFGLVETSPRNTVWMMSLYIICFLPITIGAAVFSVGENPKLTRKTSFSLKQARAIVLENLPLRRLLCADVASGLGTGTVAVLFFPLTREVFQLPDSWANLMLIVYFLSGAGFVPLMIKVSRYFGKHRTLAYSSLFNAVCLLYLLIMPAQAPYLALFVWVILGCNMAVGPFLLRSIMADVSEHDAAETETRQKTGLFISLLTLTSKLGWALAAGIALPLVQLMGFDSRIDNPPEVIDRLRAFYVFFPAALGLLAAAVMWNFPIDQARQEHNRARIAAREQTSSA